MTRDPQAVLRERARALARVDDRDAQRRGRRETLSLVRGDQWFVVPLDAVRAVAPADRLAAVPHPAPPLVGVVAVRGSLLPVYDPLPLVGPARAPKTAMPWAVVLDAASPFALLCDAMPVLEAAATADLHPPAGDLPPEVRRRLEAVDTRGRAFLAVDALRTDPFLNLSGDPPQPEHRHHDI